MIAIGVFSLVILRFRKSHVTSNLRKILQITRSDNEDVVIYDAEFLCENCVSWCIHDQQKYLDVLDWK